VVELVRRIGVFTAFGLGAFAGWVVALFMAAMGGKSVEKWVQQELAKNPIRATED
jgi:hypothetical protein